RTTTTDLSHYPKSLALVLVSCGCGIMRGSAARHPIDCRAGCDSPFHGACQQTKLFVWGVGRGLGRRLESLPYRTRDLLRQHFRAFLREVCAAGHLELLQL